MNKKNECGCWGGWLDLLNEGGGGLFIPSLLLLSIVVPACPSHLISCCTPIPFPNNNNNNNTYF